MTSPPHRCLMVVANGIIEYYCPICGRHKRYDLAKGRGYTINKGDGSVDHDGSIGGIEVGNIGISEGVRDGDTGGV